MKKVIILLIAMLAVTGMVFAQAATETAPQEARPEVVGIKIWYSISGANGEFFKSQVEAFLAEHPEIKAEEITYSGSYADSATKISAARLAGEAPDMIITSASQLYPGEDGNFRMEELVKDSGINYADFQEGILEYAKYNGRLAALPFAISTPIVYYNKDLVKKAGLDLVANPPKTWDEFVEVCKKVIAANEGITGFDASDSVWLFKSMLYQNGNPVVEQKGETITPVFDNESGIEVANYWKYLVDQGVMAAQQHDTAEKRFQAGTLAFVSATSNRLAKWAGNLGFELGAIEMPYFKTPSVALGGSTVTILTSDKWKEDACWQLIKYVLNTENQTAFSLASGYLPIRKSSLENADVKAYIADSELYAVATKQLSYAWAYTHFGAMGSMDNFFWYALDDIESGKAAPADAMKKAVKETIAEI